MAEKRELKCQRLYKTHKREIFGDPVRIIDVSRVIYKAAMTLLYITISFCKRKCKEKARL